MDNECDLCFVPREAHPVFLRAKAKTKHHQVIIKIAQKTGRNSLAVFARAQKQLMQRLVPPTSDGRSVQRPGKTEIALVKFSTGLLIEPFY